MNRENFEDIYNKFALTTLKTAMHYVDDVHAANELTQIAFLKLYKHMDHVEECKVKAWLTITVKRLAYGHTKKKVRETLYDMETADELGIFDRLAENSAEYHILKTEHEKEVKEFKEEIFEALYKKNVRWHDAVVLAYVMGKPQKEAAEELGMTVEMLYSVLHRAKQWIKENYGDRFKELK